MGREKDLMFLTADLDTITDYCDHRIARALLKGFYNGILSDGIPTDIKKSLVAEFPLHIHNVEQSAKWTWRMQFLPHPALQKVRMPHYHRCATTREPTYTHQL